LDNPWLLAATIRASDGVISFDDLLAGFIGEQLERLDHRSIVLFEPVAKRYLSPAILDPAADAHLIRIEVARSGEAIKASHTPIAE
jgi:hypothetical protein